MTAITVTTASTAIKAVGSWNASLTNAADEVTVVVRDRWHRTHHLKQPRSAA
jgi:hypothetical protein